MFTRVSRRGRSVGTVSSARTPLRLERLEDRVCLSVDLLVTSFRTNQVLRYDGATGAFQGVFASGGDLRGPDLGLIFGPDGNLYVTGYDSNSVVRYDGLTGEFLDVFVTAQSGGLRGAEGMAFGPDGHLYVANDTTPTPFGGVPGNILRYDGKTGEFLDEFVPSGSGGLSQANDLHFGADGYLYITSFNTHSVLRYDSKTGEFLDEFVPSGSGGLNQANGFTFGPDGHLYVNSSQNNSVKRYDGSTGEYLDDFVTSGSGGLRFGDGLAFGPDGHLYVNSFSTNSVKRYDGSTGEYLDDFVTAGSGGLNGSATLLFHEFKEGPAPSNPKAFGVGADFVRVVATDPFRSTGPVLPLLHPVLEFVSPSPTRAAEMLPPAAGERAAQDLFFTPAPGRGTLAETLGSWSVSAPDLLAWNLLGG